ALAKQPKLVKEKSIKPTPLKKANKGKVQKVRKGKRPDRLVDESDEEPQPDLEPPVDEDVDYDLQLGIQMSLESFQPPIGGVDFCEPATLGITQKLPVVEGKGKGIATDEHVAQSLLELHQPNKKSTTNQYIFQRRTPVTKEASTGPSAEPQDDTFANVVCDTPSHVDAETRADMDKTKGDTEILNVGEEKGEDVSNTVALEERTVELDEGQTRSEPGKTPESCPLPKRVLMEKDQAGSNPGQSHVALAGPNPEPMHEDFVATMYPQVHESLKHPDEEHVHLENPLSSSGTLLSMKNLDDAFTYGDQFLNDKPTEEEPDKANVETKVESMVTVPIYQVSSSTPSLSTPVIVISSPKPVSTPIQEPVFTATTATTTTTLPPPPSPQHQITTDHALAACVSALKQVCASLEKKNKLQDQTSQALSSKIFTLENHDLYSKIDKYINENVKEAVQDALKALVCERFRELSEFEMKEILHDRMFKSGSYRSQPKHKALYEALEASMDHPPPPPPKDFDQSKRKKHDSDASASQQPPAQTSEAWKTSNTREAPSSVSHLLKIHTRPDWLKPIPEEDRPETPEPDWVIPPNDLPKPENNWAAAIAKSYKDPKENKLL
ncbi:hypothetical protein Tco_0400430, partial [Tanacetum coccineum]